MHRERGKSERSQLSLGVRLRDYNPFMTAIYCGDTVRVRSTAETAHS
ncbi:MAG: hypothetical protein ABR543_04025 [Gemmatimonadaceae bacterium]